MRKKKKDKGILSNENSEQNSKVQSPEDFLAGFMLQKPGPVYDKNGERDYFTEYYLAYKNDYVEQYLNAYRYYKAQSKVNELMKENVTAKNIIDEAKKNKKNFKKK